MIKISIPKGPKAAKGLRALAELVEGQTLSKADHAAAEYVHGKLVDLLGPVWAQSLPADRLGKMVGKQSTQLNTFAAVGITSVKAKPVNLFEIVRQAFDTIAEHRKVIDWERSGGDIEDTLEALDRVTTEVSRLGQIVFQHETSNDSDGGSEGGELDEAKLRKLRADAARSELTLREKAGELVRVDEVAPLITDIADRLRAAGDIIGQKFGPDAQRVILGAIDKSERRLGEFRQRHRSAVSPQPADAA